jgi:IS4 transposase
MVMFKDNHENQIRVVTNLMQASTEHIADMYKARLAIEVFFRWIKQNLECPCSFWYN